MILLSKIVLVFCLIGSLAGLTGCSRPETPTVIKPEIVRKKIPANAGESVKAAAVSLPAVGSPGAPSPTLAPVPSQDDKPERAAKTAPASGMDSSSVSSPRQPADGGGSGTQPAPKSASSGSSNPQPVQVALSSVAGGFYDPAGKIDPFVPLLKDDPLKDISNVKQKREKREPTTPLERVDLSQLKLTAVVKTPSGFKAMVEETTGKGYIITVGTYVGTRSGRVTNILKDRIVVEEELEDALGNVSTSNSELKFQKPSGEL